MKLHLGLVLVGGVAIALGVLEATGQPPEMPTTLTLEGFEPGGDDVVHTPIDPEALEYLMLTGQPFVGPPDPSQLEHVFLHDWVLMTPCQSTPIKNPWPRLSNSPSGTIRFAVYLPDHDSFGVHARPYSRADSGLPNSVDLLKDLGEQIDDRRKRIQEERARRLEEHARQFLLDSWHPPLLLPDQPAVDIITLPSVTFPSDGDGPDNQDDN